MKNKFLNTILSFTFLVGIFLFVNPVSSKKEPFIPTVEFAIPQKVESNRITNLSIGKTIFLNVNETSSSISNSEETVNRWFESNYLSLGLKQIVPIQLHQIQDTPGGKVLRFRQHIDNIISFENDLVAQFDQNGRLISIHHNLNDKMSLTTTTPVVSEISAIEIAKRSFVYKGETHPPIQQLYIWYFEDIGSHLVYRVILSPAEPHGEWEFLVSAMTGELLRTRETTCYIDGSGFVFNPDPLTSAQQNYGGSWRDLNDADNTELNGQRVTRPLRSITQQTSTYSLTGPFVRILDFELPISVPVTSTTPEGFVYTRSQQGFEDVMVYAHIDSCQRHIQSLGFMNIQNTQVSVDPHGLGGDDNSHFLPSTNRIAFGEGGVDDAEDVDVIWHEYGHAIQYGQVSNWGGGESGSLGEGFGDYWAGSYSAITNTFRREWVYNWDGHNEFWSGRILNSSSTYPSGMGSSIHSNGQIWSRALMDIWDACGRTVTDRVVLQGQFAVGNGVTYPTLANAILNADVLLYQGIHLNQIFTAFQNRGILTQMPPIASIAGTVTSNTGGSPIEGVLVYRNAVLVDTSNSNGMYFIGNLGLNTYDLRFSHPLYNDRIESVTITQAGTVTRNVSLVRPIYSCNPDSIYTDLGNFSSGNFPLPNLTTLSNTGDGVGSYELEVISGSGISPWSLVGEMNIGSLIGDNRLQGIEFQGRDFIITGSNGTTNPNRIYFYDVWDGMVETFNQRSVSDVGYRELTLLNGQLVTGENDTIWKITGFSGNTDVRIPLFSNPMINPPRAIEAQLVSEDSSVLWIADNTSPIKKFSTDGQLLTQITHTRRITGITAEKHPNGKVWFVSTDNSLTELWVSELNETQTELIPITQLELPTGFRSAGVCETEEFMVDGDRRLAVLLTSSTQAIIRFYSLPKPCRYVTLNVPLTGTLQPNSSIQISANAFLDSYPPSFSFSILQKNNPARGRLFTAFLFRSDNVSENPNSIPNQFDLLKVYPNPFNSTLKIKFSTPQYGTVQIALMDILGREVYREKVIVDAGIHEQPIRVENLSSGVYFLKLTQNQNVKTSKILLLK